MPAADPRIRPSLLADASRDGGSHQLAQRPAAPHSGPPSMPGPKKKNKPPRRTLTVRLPVSVIERLRRVARDAAGVPCFATMAGLVEAGITAECDRVEEVLRAAYQHVAIDAPPTPRRINHHCIAGGTSSRFSEVES